MSTEEFTDKNMHTHEKKGPPETRVGEEGSAKRNIIRHHDKQRKGQGGSKDALRPTDDGTLDPVPILDQNDPNYESEGEEADYSQMSISEGKVYDIKNKSVIYGPKLTLREFKIRLHDIISEFFLSEDVNEALNRIEELDSSDFHYEVVKRAISQAIDRNNRERELVSRLISEGYPHVLRSGDIMKGFKRLFEIVEELQLDVPKANEYLSTFLARCIIDEVIPPIFLQDPRVSQISGEIVEDAKKKLSRSHAGAILERSWGPGDGRPVEELKEAMDQLLEEFIDSRNLDEALRCVRELDCPYFLHELVKRGVRLVLSKEDQDRLLMSSLFEYLYSKEVISSNQIRLGFNKLFEIVEDLKLDVPRTPEFLEGFKQRAISSGYLNANYEISF